MTTVLNNSLKTHRRTFELTVATQPHPTHQLIDRIQNAISEGKSIVLYGMPRVGIQGAIHAVLKDSHYIYLDLARLDYESVTMDHWITDLIDYAQQNKISHVVVDHIDQTPDQHFILKALHSSQLLFIAAFSSYPLNTAIPSTTDGPTSYSTVPDLEWIEVRPLSFPNFCDYASESLIQKNPSQTIGNAISLESQLIEQYLSLGGLPFAIAEPDESLQGLGRYWNAVVVDTANRWQLDHIAQFQDFINFAFDSIGTPTCIEKMKTLMNLSIKSSFESEYLRPLLNSGLMGILPCKASSQIATSSTKDKRHKDVISATDDFVFYGNDPGLIFTKCADLRLGKRSAYFSAMIISLINRGAVPENNFHCGELSTKIDMPPLIWQPENDRSQMVFGTLLTPDDTRWTDFIDGVETAGKEYAPTEIKVVTLTDFQWNSASKDHLGWTFQPLYNFLMEEL